jgi:hypothetical protein
VWIFDFSIDRGWTKELGVIENIECFNTNVENFFEDAEILLQTGVVIVASRAVKAAAQIFMPSFEPYGEISERTGYLTIFDIKGSQFNLRTVRCLQIGASVSYRVAKSCDSLGGSRRVEFRMKVNSEAT